MIYTYDGQGSPSAEGTGSAGAADTCQLGIGRLCSRTDESGTYTYSYDLNDNRQTRQQGTGIDSIDELIDYIEGSNRIDQQSTLKRDTGQVVVIPDRTMVCNDVQGCTSVAGAGSIGATDVQGCTSVAGAGSIGATDGQGCTSVAGAGCTGATDVGRLYQLTENNVLKAEYIYNDMGQRTKKTLYQNDGITVDSTTIYHYDNMGHLITETDLQGNLIKDYIWSNQMMPVAQIDNSGGTETITYLYTDHLVTNRLVTNNNGIITWRWEGEAFGNTPARELSEVSINLRFPGQYYDQETDLHYNWNRYYDPALGRYITSDPIGIRGGVNTYSYASQNSIVYFGPKGLFVDTAGTYTAASAAGAATGTTAAVAGAGLVGYGIGTLIYELVGDKIQEALPYPSEKQKEKKKDKGGKWKVYTRCNINKQEECDPRCPDTIGGKGTGSLLAEAKLNAEKSAKVNLSNLGVWGCQTRHCHPKVCIYNKNVVPCF